MAIHQSNFYQGWSQPSSVVSSRATPAAVAAITTAQWSHIDCIGSTIRNDWRVVGSRVDWVAKAATVIVGNTALWTAINGSQQSFRNDWKLQGNVSSFIAQAESLAELPLPSVGGQTSTYAPRYNRELQIAREGEEIIEILSILAIRRLI